MKNWAVVLSFIVPMGVVSVHSADEWAQRSDMYQGVGASTIQRAAWAWKEVWVPKSQETKRAERSNAAVPYSQLTAQLVHSSWVELGMTSTLNDLIDKTPGCLNPLSADAKVLLLGDSLMGGVAIGLRSLKAPVPVQWIDRHKISTGLANLGYYNWPEQARQATAEVQPQYVLFHLGGNDQTGMGIRDQGVWHAFGTPSWQQVYRLRMEEMIRNVQQEAPSAQLAWIGLPAVKNPQHHRNGDIIRETQRSVAQQLNIPYLEASAALGEAYIQDGLSRDGQYRNFRASDGVHYSVVGARAMASLTGWFDQAQNFRVKEADDIKLPLCSNPG